RAPSRQGFGLHCHASTGWRPTAHRRAIGKPDGRGGDPLRTRHSHEERADVVRWHQVLAAGGEHAAKAMACNVFTSQATGARYGAGQTTLFPSSTKSGGGATSSSDDGVLGRAL